MSRIAKVTLLGCADMIVRVSEAWFEAVVDVLRRDGAVVVSTVEVGDVEEWRRAVRRACRAAGLRIRTGVSKSGRAWVEHVDHVVTEAEMQAVARTVDNALGGGPKRPFHELVREERRKQLTVVSDVTDATSVPDREAAGEVDD